MKVLSGFWQSLKNGSPNALTLFFTIPITVFACFLALVGKWEGVGLCSIFIFTCLLVWAHEFLLDKKVEKVREEHTMREVKTYLLMQPEKSWSEIAEEANLVLAEMTPEEQDVFAKLVEKKLEEAPPAPPGVFERLKRRLEVQKCKN